jgi:hypothetical protein
MPQTLGTVNNVDNIALESDLAGLVPSNGLITGGVFYSGVGFNYDVSACTYRIAGILYTSAATSVTLSASDPTFDRIDVIYADDTGSVGVITGTPSPSPVKPSVNATTQVEITFVTVTAGSTAPGVVNVLVYNEDTGSPGEWNGTSDDVNVDFASVNDPYSGTVSVETTSPLGAKREIIFTPAVAYTINGGYLTFRIKAKQDMSTASGTLYIAFTVGGSVVGTILSIGGSTLVQYGFDATDTTNYQLVTIPISSFGALPTTIDALWFFKLTGTTTANFYLDLIQIQEGTFTPPPTVSGHEIQDESIALTQRNVLDFQGAGVTVTDDPINEKTVVTIPGGGGGGTWYPTSITLGDTIANGASAAASVGAGYYYTFDAASDDELLINIELQRNGLTYDGASLRLDIQNMLVGAGGVGDTVLWELDYAFVNDGDNAYTKVDGTVVNSVNVNGRASQIQFTDSLPTISGLAGSTQLQLTLRRNSQGAGADSFGGSVEVYALGLVRI